MRVAEAKGKRRGGGDAGGRRGWGGGRELLIDLP